MTEEYTVSTIDQGLASIYTRLNDIANHLEDGVNGEHPKVGNETDKAEINTPSLNSNNQRIGDVQTIITRIENLTKSIHS